MAIPKEELFRRAITSLEANKLDDAERLFMEVLHHDPKHVAALNLLGIVLTYAQKYREAEPYFRSALTVSSNSDATYYNYGVVLKALKRPDEALERFSQALAINSKIAETWNNRGTVLNELNRYEDALADLNKAIFLNENYPDAYCNKGKSLYELKRYDDALVSYERALTIRPNFAEAWLGCGNVFGKLKRYDEALTAYETASTIKPELAEVWLGRGNVFYDLRRHNEALAAYDHALALNFDLINARVGRANAFSELKSYDEALATYEDALLRDPNLAEAWLGCGNILAEHNRHSEALAAYSKSIVLKPGAPNAWLGRGNVFRELGHFDEAFAAYDKALELEPDFANVWLGRGNILYDLKRYDEAFEAYDKAVKLKPDLIGAEGMRLSAKLYQCNWSNIDAECKHLVSRVSDGSEAAPPFLLLAIPSSCANQLQCAKRWTNVMHPAAKSTIWRGERYQHDRVRIAYVSSDFRQHPMSFLIAGFIEKQDRNRFEVIGISLQAEDPSEIGQRMKHAFDKYFDVSQMADEKVANLIRELEVDIAVDLNGYTRNGRTNIFAQRPAPIQVSYMGFPGTMGAEYIDYIIADKTVISAEMSPWFLEKIVWMPNTYWVADQKLPTGLKKSSRSAVGLPENSFVFCCFNQQYKILPDIFDCWMRVLNRVNRSVLWLLEDNATATKNLKSGAARRGVDPDRLVFAPRIPMPEHLARHSCADLYLDTLPYNGHTTASDALRTGLPVLTQIGETFASRVAASSADGDWLTRAHNEDRASL